MTTPTSLGVVKKIPLHWIPHTFNNIVASIREGRTLFAYLKFLVSTEWHTKRLAIGMMVISFLEF